MGPLNRRGSVPVIAEVLLVGVVVVIGLVVITLALGIAEDVDSPSPVVSETNGIVVQTGSGDTIELTHVTGDVVPVGELTVVVDAESACGAQTRLVGLPADSEAFLTPENVEGAPIVSTDNRSTAAFDLGALTRDRFASGDSFEIQLTDDCPLEPGDEVTIILVHQPEDAIVSTTEITVGGS
jgi:FlaG/FlaF family flagellin (archaellin)